MVVKLEAPAIRYVTVCLKCDAVLSFEQSDIVKHTLQRTVNQFVHEYFIKCPCNRSFMTLVNPKELREFNPMMRY